MSAAPTHLLDDLASKPEQVRFMIGGTADEYLDPHDLLNDAFHFCERVKADPLWSWLGDDKIQKVDQFERALKDRGGCVDRYTHATIADLVEHDRDWAYLRESAEGLVELFKQKQSA